nr:hypothetical protein CFP56_44740 [Quercus suber]
MVAPSGGNMGSNSFEEMEGPNGNNINSKGGIGEVSVVELHSSLVGIVGVDVDVVNSLSVEVGEPSDQAVYLVAFVELKLGQVGTALPGDSGDQCDFVWRAWRRFAVGCRSRSGFVAILDRRVKELGKELKGLDDSAKYKLEEVRERVARLVGGGGDSRGGKRRRRRGDSVWVDL